MSPEFVRSHPYQISSPHASALPSYLPQLDSLRALALLMVICNHWLTFQYTGNWLMNIPLAAARIGWSGVDLFFVISGFLITGILIDTRDSPHYFRNFYARRALRILPLYYAVLVLLVFVLPAIPAVRALPTYQYRENGAIWDFAFLTNIAEGMGFANSRLLVPYWSLAVEEHFYLIWPLLVYQYRGSLARVCIIGIAGSCLARIVLLHLAGSNEHLIGFLTPCRLDGLLGGALLAVLVRRGEAMIARLVRLARWAAPISFLSLPGCLLLQELQGRYHMYDSGQHPWVVSLGFLGFAIFFSSLVVLCTFDGFMKRLTALKPAIVFGRITYCAYLTHEPVHVLVVGSLMGAVPLVAGVLSWNWVLATGLAFGVTVILATVSWRFFEMPILSMKRYFTAREPACVDASATAPVTGFAGELDGA